MPKTILQQINHICDKYKLDLSLKLYNTKYAKIAILNIKSGTLDFIGGCITNKQTKLNECKTNISRYKEEPTLLNEILCLTKLKHLRLYNVVDGYDLNILHERIITNIFYLFSDYSEIQIINIGDIKTPYIYLPE